MFMRPKQVSAALMALWLTKMVGCSSVPTDRNSKANLTSFASLCAADFEANNQLAALIGEKDFSTLYHQGTEESMYLSKIARDVIRRVRAEVLAMSHLRSPLDQDIDVEQLSLHHFAEAQPRLQPGSFAGPCRAPVPACPARCGGRSPP